MSFISNKPKAREFFKKSRDSLTPEQIQQKSQTICKRCLQLSQVQQAKHIALYAATSSEVQTDPLFNALMQQAKSIYYPKVLNKTEVGLFLVKDLKELMPGSYGILEPLGDSALQVSPDLIEVFFVPGLAFDHRGHRLGFGKGYYDRLLSQTKALKVGLAFAVQLTSELELAPHDVKMDFILSEKSLT
ncbi:MAG: 5-formyltetrahydrofolate cyclo-ligase [Deltaproteobacteria bacterium]|nr:5-formyltetrahydrofolate cyclo-ligase [Deltaproteobacteria bacterium]